MKLKINSKTHGIIEFQIDKEDYDRIKGMTWGIFYHKRRDVFVVRNSQRVGLHRIIMNAPKGTVVDHINHDTLDNRKKNLRICTNQENLRNQKISKRNTCGFKGVTFHKPANKYLARISINGKLKHLGYFNTAQEAAISYNNAALKHYKEFACLNQI